MKKDFPGGCRGFTLIEIMIVIAIISALAIIGMASLRKNIDKARDADRKQDLQRLSVAFEDYYNDYECYPNPGVLAGPIDGLKPYLDKIPRDPITKLPYFLQHSTCTSYRILIHLNNDSDPAINNLNCNPNCGFPDDPEANYGITSTNIPVSNNPLASPSPSDEPRWYCSEPGNCTGPIPTGKVCNPSYDNTNCLPTSCAGITSVCTDL